MERNQAFKDFNVLLKVKKVQLRINPELLFKAAFLCPKYVALCVAG